MARHSLQHSAAVYLGILRLSQLQLRRCPATAKHSLADSEDPGRVQPIADLRGLASDAPCLCNNAEGFSGFTQLENVPNLLPSKFSNSSKPMSVMCQVIPAPASLPRNPTSPRKPNECGLAFTHLCNMYYINLMRRRHVSD